ncbi:hypothetical protein PoB_006360000 [Plakobranchus ocellatus]|uniref:Uncharacterized protein n=1 Tax=Plakobranchus ocellatus TaxID=259542 RepID=A0AAV4CZ97_9GAST|nr:hypothetical protein PoB_006360000 [Plakobranchus ocellatus]
MESFTQSEEGPNIVVTPLLSSKSYPSVSEGSQSSSDHSDSYMGSGHRENLGANDASDGKHKRDGSDMEYLVESTHTVERRLRCLNLHRFLSDCRLEECAIGAVLISSGHPTIWPFGSPSCMLSSRAALVQLTPHHQIDACTCMHVLSVISELDIWRVRLFSRNETHCLMLLNSPPQGYTKLSEVYALKHWKTNAALTSRPTPRLEELGSKVKNGLETDAYCSRTVKGQLQLCFYPSANDKEWKGKAPCVHVSIESKACNI